ncbi:PRP40 pre-mRNA processing factor 40 [Entomortierella beljakovae]|nr:PRP40 pre-mRNA processing factor 40 [Entomortierella beljakovae]
MAETQPKTLWVEYTHQDGRKYYYYPPTRQTVWQKPDELKTQKELALESSPWKEYTTPEGKKYYHNSATKETVWTVPDDYKILLDQLEEETKAKEAAAAAATTTPQPLAKPLTPTSSSAVSTPSPLRHQTIIPGNQPTPVQAQQQQPPPSIPIQNQNPMQNINAPPSFMPRPRPPYPLQQQQGPRPRYQQSFIPDNSGANRGREKNPNETPEFSTKEEAEEAFKNMLKETGVTSTWTWEKTMRAVVTNPMYRALKTTAERKTAFQEYVDERHVLDKQEEKVRQQKLRDEFLELLKGSDKVTHASRYTTISRLFAEEPAFKAITDDRLRYSIFDGYVSELVRQEKEDARQKRKAGMTALATLLLSMEEITIMTRWAEAMELLNANTEFKGSELIRGLSKLDQLSVFEDHTKHLEIKYDQKRAQERVLRKRAERKRREAFKELLADLRSKGQINAKTSWMQIHPLIKEDPRYLGMLGQPGSTPMELFWDLIEDLDERLYQDRKMIQELLRNIDYDVQPESTLEEFQAVMSKQEKAPNVAADDLKLIFEQLVAKATHHAKEEKRRQEKLARKKAESFRFVLKSLNPAVTVESSWDDVRSKVELTPEYAAIETDEIRKGIFDRYLERLKASSTKTTSIKERIAKDHDSDDEDGSILEDDADFYGKRSSGDRKRSAPSSGYSKHHSSSSGHHHHGSHHSNGDHHRRSNASRDQTSPAPPKSSQQNGKHDRGDVASEGSGAEDESDHKAKKSKTDDEIAHPDPIVTKEATGQGQATGSEDGEVVETPNPQ